MADNVTLPGTGAIVATDDVGSAHYQYVKAAFGADGTATKVSSSDPLPVSLPAATVVTLTPPAAITGFGTAANQATIIGHVDGIEALLTTIDGDTGTLAVVGGGAESSALRVTIANDSTGLVSVDDGGGALTVDNAGTFAVQSRDAQAAANNAGSQVSVTTTTTVLASNASRKGAKVYADPANTQIVYVKLGATATSSNFPLHPGDSIDLNFGGAVYTGVVDAIAASGTQAVNVLEI